MAPIDPDLAEHHLEHLMHSLPKHSSTTHPEMPARPAPRAPRRLSAMSCAAAALAISATTVAAHPHVWVTVETTVDYVNGTVTGLSHKWTFDEMYTAMAIQGLDTNNDGQYDRKELAELAQVNIDGLKEFDYFTFAKLGSSALAFDPPKDYWLEYTNGMLSLHMTTPLKQPVLAEAEGLSFAVYDPSYFIAFELSKTNPVKVSDGAPTGCTASVDVPKEDAELAKKLADALQVDTSGSVGNALGGAVAKTINVGCRKP